MYFHRTQNEEELEDVLVKRIHPIATIEIKYSNSQVLSRGVYECIGYLGISKNFVVTPKSKSVVNKEGILTVSLLNFFKGGTTTF